MFSGIVQEVGVVESTESVSGILEIAVFSTSKVMNNLRVGDSVAVNGCCQTVVSKNEELFKIQATQETIAKTNLRNLMKGSKVNLETPLKLGDQISGHLVSGHVDAVGEVSEIIFSDENRMVKILFPKQLRDFIASKGSITVNGVSLTIVDLREDEFNFALIPYTRDNTNLGLIKAGDLVNLEVDLVSRYLVNYLQNNVNLVKR